MVGISTVVTLGSVGGTSVTMSSFFEYGLIPEEKGLDICLISLTSIPLPIYFDFFLFEYAKIIKKIKATIRTNVKSTPNTESKSSEHPASSVTRRNLTRTTNRVKIKRMVEGKYCNGGFSYLSTEHLETTKYHWNIIHLPNTTLQELDIFFRTL